MKRFELDAEQTDAILELKIYRLARLEILIIRKELEEKRKRARQIGALLKDEAEPLEAGRAASSRRSSKKYGDKRRTTIASDSGEPEYTADDFIVEEDNVVHRVARRLGEAAEGSEGSADDARCARAMRCWRRSPAARARRCVFFSNFGVAYTSPHHRRAGVDRLRRADPAAVQAEGRRDGSSRRSASTRASSGNITPRKEGAEPPVHAVAVTSDGYACDSASSRSSSRARARAAATRGRPKAPRSSASSALTGGEILIAATARGRGHAVQGRRGELPVRPGQRRDPHQAVGRATACSASSPRPATATC